MAQDKDPGSNPRTAKKPNQNKAKSNQTPINHLTKHSFIRYIFYLKSNSRNTQPYQSGKGCTLQCSYGKNIFQFFW